MSYQSLYRKYRPTKFDDVYGQSVAKKILKNAIESQEIAHAYLFFGPRGTGKTSLAKMFARMCNCLQPIDGNCCDNCDNCLESMQKNCVDIIEIDAASNNGVDEIRELKNKINLVPSKLKYKVYIIDEVHMLSSGAFNALLKTLEEPPSHVIFILATTEFYKVPETIVSRCQCIEFKFIDDISMQERLSKISTEENIPISDEALYEIVKNSNGGLRDAIGLLDKVKSYSFKSDMISVDDVREVLGLITHNELSSFLKSLLDKNQTDLLNKIQFYSSSGFDIFKIVSDLIFLIRNCIINEKKYEYIDLLNELNEFQKSLKNSFNQKIMFELFAIEWSLNNTPNKYANDLNSSVKISEAEINNNSDNFRLSNETETINVDINKNSNLEKLIDIRINNSFVNANKSELNICKSAWKNLESHSFDKSNGSFVCDLLDTEPVLSNKEYIVLCVQYDSLSNIINKNVKIYESMVKDLLGIDKKLVVIEEKKWEILKKQYVNNIKNGYKYEIIVENDHLKQNNNSVELNNTALYNKALNLFGEIVKEDE